MVKRILFSVFLAVGVIGWCSPALAARQVLGVGDVTPLSVSGSNEGVDLTGSSTLLVNDTIEPLPNIYKDNSSLSSVTPAVTASAHDAGEVVFNNNSTVYGDMGAIGTALHLITVSDGVTVNFLGDVYSAGAPYGLNTGTGATNFRSGSTNVTAMNFTADGTITLSPNTTVIGALTTFAAKNGTLVLGSGSTLDGAVGGATGLKSVNVVGGSNTAGVSATITGAANSNAFSLGTNTLYVSGALTMPVHTGDYTSGVGILSTTLASSLVYGRIIVAGSSNIGSALGVNVLVPSTAYIPVGTQFNVIQAASGTDNSVISVHVDNPTNPLYTFTTLTQAHGQVTIKVASIPMQTSTNPVVPVLQDIPSTPDLDEVLAPINALTDPVEVDQAVAQLAPSTPSLASPLVAFRETRQFQDLWLAHMDTVACDEVSMYERKNEACRRNEQNSGWWAKGFGYTGTQDAQDGFTEYDAKTIGGMMAYDRPLGDNTRVGLGLGYGQTEIDGKTFDAETDFDTYQATVYMGHENGPWFLNGDLSFGWNEYSSMRHMVFPGFDRIANADYSGQTYTAFASTGVHVPIQKFTITPLASLHYGRVKIEDYTETGAGDVSLKVKSQSYDFLESGLGVKVERPFTYRGGAYVPEVHAKWLHKIVNPALEQTAAYTAAGSTYFTTNGLNTADDTYNAGAGLMLLSCSDCSSKIWSIEAVYDYDWTSDGYDAHQVMAKYTRRF